MPVTDVPELISGLSAVAGRYDLLLCDVWGVVHDGVRASPEACAAMQRFKEERGPVILLSNAPRPGSAVLPQLDRLGAPASAWSAIVTSGDATRAVLKAAGPGPVWAVGPARDVPLYAGLDIEFCETVDQGAYICCTGPFDDDIETPDDYVDRFRVGVARGLHMICANPDRVVQRGGTLIYCAGALAALYQELGGEVTTLGKPHPGVYKLCFSEAERLAGRATDRSRVLCIGDGLPTDVKGANAEGLDCLFIGAGIHAVDTLDASGALDLARTGEFLQREGAHARYAMTDLSW